MYVKLFTKILDSSISDNRRLRHFFTDLLLCSDMTGMVIMTESAIARRIGCDISEVEWGLAELQKPDPRSHTPDYEGRRIEKLEGIGYGWRILNFEIYRAMKDADHMRRKTAERVRKHREKTYYVTPCNTHVTPCNVTVTPCNPIAEAEAEAEVDNTLGAPASPPAPAVKKKVKRVIKTDEELIATYRDDPTYAGIDIATQLGKMRRWCLVNHKEPSERRFVNWLNRAEKPIGGDPLNGALMR